MYATFNTDGVVILQVRNHPPKVCETLVRYMILDFTHSNQSVMNSQALCRASYKAAVLASQQPIIDHRQCAIWLYGRIIESMLRSKFVPELQWRTLLSAVRMSSSLYVANRPSRNKADLILPRSVDRSLLTRARWEDFKYDLGNVTARRLTVPPAWEVSIPLHHILLTRCQSTEL